MSVFSVSVGQSGPQGASPTAGGSSLTPRQQWDAAELAAEQMMANTRTAPDAAHDLPGSIVAFTSWWQSARARLLSHRQPRSAGVSAIEKQRPCAR